MDQIYTRTYNDFTIDQIYFKTDSIFTIGNEMGDLCAQLFIEQYM